MVCLCFIERGSRSDDSSESISYGLYVLVAVIVIVYLQLAFPSILFFFPWNNTLDT